MGHYGHDGGRIFTLQEGLTMKASYTLRLPEELRQRIKEESIRRDMSINQYILYTLTKDLASKDAAIKIKARIKKAPSVKEALALLDTIVPDVAPLDSDRLPSA